MRDVSLVHPVISTVVIGADPRRDLVDDLRGLSLASEGGVVVRAYSWDRPTVVLGANQPLDELNLVHCREAGIGVVRRPSGGRAALHDHDLGVSLALPSFHPWATGIRRLYDRFTHTLQGALRSMGYPVTKDHDEGGGGDSPVCFEHHGPDGLYLRGRRLFGSSQVRRRQAVLVHGTLLLRFDPHVSAEVFGRDPTRLEERITSLEAPGRAWEVAWVLVRALAQAASAEGAKAQRVFAPALLPQDTTR